MTFADTPAGAAIFLDANTLVYHFANEPKYGAACTQLIKQVEQKQLSGFASTPVVADVCHRLMTLEAIALLGWPAAGIAVRLRRHHGEIAKLTVYEQAVARIPLLGVQVLQVTQSLLATCIRILSIIEANASPRDRWITFHEQTVRRYRSMRQALD